MNVNPDLRRHVRTDPIELPQASQLVSWVGRHYAEGECWKLVRDAFEEVGGVKLSGDYYNAVKHFTQVHDARSGEPFTPQPWDVPMLRTIDNIPILVLHPGLTVDGERFLQTWGSAGATLFRFDDERVSFRIVGFIRLLKQ